MVVGQQEVENKTVTVRERDDKSKKQKTFSLSEFYEYLESQQVDISSLRKDIQNQSEFYSEEDLNNLQ